MKLISQKATLRSIKTDAAAVFIPEDKKQFQQQISELRKYFGKHIDDVVSLEQFKGKSGTVLSVLTNKKLSTPRLLLVGLLARLLKVA